MIKLGLIREGKMPPDNRVALTPGQCRWIKTNYTDIEILVQHSNTRCFHDNEYQRAGITVKEDISECDVMLGIKEVPIHELVADRTYLIFSHTKKKQPHNRLLLKAILEKNITLIDYECLEHADGQRILGFGFFAGIVGAHNGMMAYGKRTRLFDLNRVYEQKSLRKLIHTYFGLRLPPIKIAVTGSGRVASGILEVMNLLGIIEVEPDEYLEKSFAYPVYVHLKGPNLYANKESGKYNREDFHHHPSTYHSLFYPYTKNTDILMNGIYWDTNIPKLFEWHHLKEKDFRIKTIADVTDDTNGSVPCNIADATIAHPVYGVDKITRQLTEPYQPDGIDVMAVSNLPNELPRDASKYFGEQLIKFVLDHLLKGNSPVLDHASIVKKGRLNGPYLYLEDYVAD